MSQRPPPLTPHTILATWFWSGWLRPAPGTWGTLAGIPFAIPILIYGGPIALLGAAVICFAVGCWAASQYDAATGGHDASEIVIDEVAGIWVTLGFSCMFVPFSAYVVVIAFFWFRVFDITKPFPVRLADKNVEGGFGVMLDDFMAALYAAMLTIVTARTVLPLILPPV